VIELLRSGSLKPSEYLLVRPRIARSFVKKAGKLERVVVMKGITLGDDLISGYELHFADGLYPRIGVAADGRISTLGKWRNNT
jgi:hypothetical protein